MARRKPAPLVPLAGTLYFTDQQICHRFGVSKQTLWRWRRGRNFPMGVKVGGWNAPNKTSIAAVELWEAAHLHFEGERAAG